MYHEISMSIFTIRYYVWLLTCTFIIFSFTGDGVSVENSLSDHNYWGQKYSSFGGFLIQEFETGSSEIVG